MPEPVNHLEPAVAVVIPCYKVRQHILGVVAGIGPEVDVIVVVDDACPEGSGRLVEAEVADSRVRVVYHEINQGVGAATLTGMKIACNAGAKILVKIDGDDQMDPRLILPFVQAIRTGIADYAKGNRFYDIESLSQMPWVRLLGNAGLSFLAKASTGYWQNFDPTNGFFAVHSVLFAKLPHEKIAKRYFFETDMLFRLNLLGAKVVDVPMAARYGNEKSSLSPLREAPKFFIYHMRNFFKRIFYSYFLRGFSVASVELVVGVGALCFGLAYGAIEWADSSVATAGSVMIAGISILTGMQLVLSFLNYDIGSQPQVAKHPLMQPARTSDRP